MLADAYAELLAELPAEPVLLRLVPRASLAASELDATLGRAVLDRLTRTSWLPAATPRSRHCGPTGRSRSTTPDAPSGSPRWPGVLPGLLRP
ncbi:hypothetical protein A7K94_0220150, partial [Modestobacter sp. VKM Ac-2676]